jgi:hypothetical protein
MTLPSGPFVCENFDVEAAAEHLYDNFIAWIPDDNRWKHSTNETAKAKARNHARLIVAAALGEVIPAEVETGMLEELAQVEPITWSTEGLDDGCLFCGVDAKCVWEPEYERYAVHRPTCLWVRVRLLLGHDLGIHRVDGQPVVSDKE